jgi:hypothetical protein
MIDPNVEQDKDGSFIVGESALLNYIFIAIYTTIFFGILLTRDFERENSFGSFLLYLAAILIPLVASIVKLKKNRSIIVVNRKGIYYHNNFITDWNNFVYAYIMEETPMLDNNGGGLSDKFSIQVIYYDHAKGENYIYKMKSSDSQNKSEEQIILAIQYFSGKVLSNEVLSD